MCFVLKKNIQKNLKSIQQFKKKIETSKKWNKLYNQIQKIQKTN
jgi:hypothetical protein